MSEESNIGKNQASVRWRSPLPILRDVLELAAALPSVEFAEWNRSGIGEKFAASRATLGEIAQAALIGSERKTARSPMHARAIDVLKDMARSLRRRAAHAGQPKCAVVFFDSEWWIGAHGVSES